MGGTDGMGAGQGQLLELAVLGCALGSDCDLVCAAVALF